VKKRESREKEEVSSRNQRGERPKLEGG